MRKFITYLPLVAILALPFLAIADETVDAPVELPRTIATGASLLRNINTIINWIFVFLLAFAVIYILVAAYGYLTAQGDPAKIKTAQAQLTYAIWAIIIGVLAKTIVIVVANILGAGDVGLGVFGQ